MKIKINLALVILSLISCLVQAAETELSKQKFSVNASLGYISGTAHEYVYNPDNGTQLSHLLWKMENAPIIRAEGAYKINSWLDAGLNAWINLNKGNYALMDDYDWYPPIVPFFMWSDHPDTDLRQASEVDLNLKGWFLQKSNYKLAAMVGYQRNLYSFVAKGGCFNYYFGAFVGCFPEGQIGIGYKQTFNMPYIGLAGNYLWKLWELTGHLKYSNQVTARDIDQHYQYPPRTFYEGSNNFKYYNLNLNAGYYVKPQIKLFAEGSFNYIPNKKTGSVVIDQLTNERTDYADAAGLSNQNYIFSLGIQYTGGDS